MEPTAAFAAQASTAAHALDTTLRRTRRRWRLRVALRGLAIAVGATLAALLVAAWVLYRAQYSDQAITAARLTVWLVAAMLGYTVWGWVLG